MLRNKRVVKKLRNILFLGMILIIVLGVYNTILRSKAENTIPIAAEMTDKLGQMTLQEVQLEAVEKTDGTYSVELPKTVNEYYVTKYYTAEGEEIVLDGENVTELTLTAEEVENQKIQLEIDYDKKEVVIGEEIFELYNKALASDKSVTVSGYMPVDTKLEVTEIAFSTLTSVTLPDKDAGIGAAYGVQVYQETEQTVVEEETTTEVDKIEYDPTIYNENFIIEVAYDTAGIDILTYSLNDDNTVSAIENKTEDGTIEFIINKNSKFIIAEKIENVVDTLTSSGLQIGDFVNYDAGTWTQAEMNAIQVGEITDLKTANFSNSGTSLPCNTFEFGGFVAGSSRNGNVKPYNKNYDYVKDKATGEAITGWRVFDIADDGSVTLISAGNPEAYYHEYYFEGDAYVNEYILTGQVNGGGFTYYGEEEIEVNSSNISDYWKKRDWSNYINISQKAVSATVLTKSKLDSWYSKYIESGANTYNNTTFKKIYYESEYQKYQNMIENYSYYWLSEAGDHSTMNLLGPTSMQASYGISGAALGLRVLVTLSPEAAYVITGTKTVTGGNTTTYGGDQTYNVWNIDEKTLQIGDFVNYDAGTWTQAEIDAIQTGEIGNKVTANGSTSLPNTAFQFGGFEAGDSRNGNATPNTDPWEESVNASYVKDGSTGEAITGWRVFDIADDGTVTLISAGNPEDYYHDFVGDGTAYVSEYILTGQVNGGGFTYINPDTEESIEVNSSNISSYWKKRNWSSYINASQKAVSATVLTKSRLDSWYSKYIEANANTETVSTFQKIYETPYTKYQNMIENFSYYWLSEAYNFEDLYYVESGYREVIAYWPAAFGVRVLVTLSPEASFAIAGTKTVTGGHTTEYGGYQKYNVWDITTEESTDTLTWSKVSDSADPLRATDKGGSIATVKVKAESDIFASGELTTEDITVHEYVNGQEITSTATVSLSEPTTLTNGVEYTITVTGYATNVNQLKIGIAGNTTLTTTGKSNKAKEMIIFNTLKSTLGESTFMGSDVEFLGHESIQRQYVENITFVSSTEGKNETAWDVSAQGDGSILAWYTSRTEGTYEIYTVYIGSDSTIYGNQDSTSLFSGIGDSSYCKATEVITNIELLNTINVTNMGMMFFDFGNKAMTTLSLGNNFDTSNVTEMDLMFAGTGSAAMTTLSLGNNFDTSKVTNMFCMFLQCGTESMTSLDLGDKFDTSNVTDMSSMFNGCGSTAMTSLDLGDKFDTSNVTHMSYMFDGCGSTAMTSLDLGDKFDTTNVRTMSYMFNGCGSTAMTSLDLGPRFTQIPSGTVDFVTNTGMSNDTNNACTIYAPESIYKNANNFKLNASSTTEDINYARGTINPKYKTEWTKVSSTVDSSKKTVTIVVNATETWSGSAYASNSLQASNIHVYFGGNTTEISVNKSISSSPITNGVQYTIVLSNFEESSRQTGKSFTEWSGEIALKIDAKTVLDIYGNGNLETTIVSDDKGSMYADFIAPEFTYAYASSDIDKTKKRVWVTFDVVDKYFKETTLTDASQVTVKINGKDITTKSFYLIKDISETVDGTEKVIGKRYELVITDIDDVGSGIITVAIPAGIATDTSNNSNVAKTITVGVNVPGGTGTGTVVDFIKPVITYKESDLTVNAANNTVTVIFEATDDYFSSSSLTKDDITVGVNEIWDFRRY